MADWDPAAEARYAAQLAPLLTEIAQGVQTKLPAGIHFAVLVVVPPAVPGGEGRVLSVATDRALMARMAGQWVLQILDTPDTEGPG
jgi:hypothetical protein